MSIAAIAFVSSLVLTAAYRQFALRSGWLDHPNQRSSHTQITPRGAGVVFGLLILGLAPLLLRDGQNLRNALLCGAAVIASGWWDDIRGLSAQARLAGYTLATAAAVIALFGLPASLLAWGYGALAVLGLLWLVNLYNFMDGINGIAASEAIFVLISVLVVNGDAVSSAMIGFLLVTAGAIGGFLWWNFPTAKVFMGDAGSAFLGFLFGVLILSSPQWGGPKATTWLILLGVFIVDSAYTLTMRIVTGQRWHQAHRLHAYQKLSRKLNSHSRALTLIMTVNLLWLLPWAWWAELGDSPHQLIALFAAYLPLVLICRAVNAGGHADH